MASFRILSFCGGGMRGLMSAAILQRLDAEFYAQNDVRLIDQADMVAGTSTGSIISGLLLLGVTPELIVDFYLTVVRAGFAKGQHNSDAPELPGSTWIAAMDKYGLDRPLSAFAHKNVLLTAFDIGAAGRAWSPQLFHNLANSTNADIGLFDAISGSGGMPAMVPPHAVTLGGETLNLVDGAFVHHDPIVPAIAAAASNGIDVATISAIDIGTGFMQNMITADASGWGASQWLNGTGAPDGTLPALFVNTPAAQAQMPILNLCLNGTSTNLMPELAGMLLPGRFAYLNPDFGSTYIPEDATDATSIAFLQDQAAQCDLTQALAVLQANWLD